MNKEKDVKIKQEENYIAIGMSLGMCFGVSIGMCIGMGIGSLIKK